MTKHSKPTLKKIEQLFEELQYSVRYEKGNFNSGYCIVDDKKIVVVNKFFDTESRVNILTDILFIISVDEEKLSDKSRLLFQQVHKSHLSLVEKN
ncbi:MAG: hypothetical protein IPM42_04570 [Saprospiraceae bacterium]|nr:hypothetical protein [Saprospiraceae bacterium]